MGEWKNCVDKNTWLGIKKIEATMIDLNKLYFKCL